MSALTGVLENVGIEVRAGKIVLPPWCERVKLDVGLSSNAPQAATWLERDPGLLVFGFEPVSENIEHIRRGSSPHRQRIDPQLVGARFFPIPIALGAASQPTTKRIYVTSIDTGCSSLLRPRTFEVGYEEEVAVWPLSSFLQMFPFEDMNYIDHLKTDCQGTDLEILRGADYYLRHVLAVTAECEDKRYLGSRNSKRSMGAFMAAQGFIRLVPRERRTAKRIAKETVQDPRFLRGLTSRKARDLALKSIVEDPTYVRIQDYLATGRTDLLLWQVG